MASRLRTVGRSEAKAAIARVEGEITCETMLLDLDRRSIDLGTAAHEMIHQLAAESGLLPRHDAFPAWLHEGLAAQFEVIRGGRWSGISRAHDLRLPDWRRIQDPIPLERLVRDAGFGRGYQRDLYAQAWALVYYLAHAAFARIPDVPGPAARPGYWRRARIAARRAVATECLALFSVPSAAIWMHWSETGGPSWRR